MDQNERQYYSILNKSVEKSCFVMGCQIMNFEECLKKELIKKDAEAPLNSAESLNVSLRFLEQAKGNLKMKYYIACELLAYNASFHAARVLLFSKGYRERSHVCLVVALQSIFEDDTELSDLLNTFDQLRLSRHNVQYSGALVDEQQAKIVFNFSTHFI
jgi:uncharacterized protein (UPF0332 family)